MNHLHSHHEDHGHDEKDDKFKSQLVGLSIGLMAVMVAVCAALGNTERNLMTQDLIKQAQATSKESGASVKLRIVLLDLQKICCGCHQAKAVV